MRIFLCWFAGPVAALILLVGARMCLFTVDRAEYVYVTQFGRHIATYDGADAGDAGLHWKWPAPIQSIHRLDRRLQVFDLPARELPTNDPEGRTIDKMLTLDAYVCWRISGKDGVDRFLKTGPGERAAVRTEGNSYDSTIRQIVDGTNHFPCRNFVDHEVRVFVAAVGEQPAVGR